MSTILISCGEASGDLYAGALAAEIFRLDPSARVIGFGGERLRASGAQLVGDYRGLAVTGLSEALAVLPRSLAMYRRLVSVARSERPDVFVAIDFPDFNFRLARALNRMAVPIVYYIGPQLWAWRPGRLQTMKRWAAHVLVIFPFEEAIYREAAVPVTFVGHPLVDLARVDEPRESFLARLGLDPAAPTLALLPGSRPNELRAMLPVLVAAVDLVAGRVPGLQVVVARAPNLDAALLAPLSAGAASRRWKSVTVESETDEALAAADVALTASGTATVQAALHDRPMVIVYAVSPLTYRLGRRLVRIDTFGMVNLVAGRKIVPELIQEDFTPEAVAAEAVSLLTDAERVREIRCGLAEVRARLGAPGASRRAAQAILDVASARRAPAHVAG